MALRIDLDCGPSGVEPDHNDEYRGALRTTPHADCYLDDVGGRHGRTRIALGGFLNH